MSALNSLIPFPHLIEIDGIDVAAPAPEVWERARHRGLAQSLAVRALFRLRSLTSAKPEGVSRTICIDDLTSSSEHPGFQVLVDDPPYEFAVGAIGKVWRLDIPFAHVGGADEYAAFAQPDFIKVAWAIRVSPHGDHHCHVEVEVRVHATSDRAWRNFHRYFRVIGPFSRLIRRSLLRALAREALAPDRAAA